MMKKLVCLLLAAVLCMAWTLTLAEEAAPRDLEAEKAAFLETLQAEGRAEVGVWKVERIRDNVYHMDEDTVGNPGGSISPEGVFNNPSSIYFIVEEGEVLIVDLGNPTFGEGETDAKVIMEAMTAGKPVTILLTHSHGDHTGLGRSTAVFENIDVQKVLIGAPDLETAMDAIGQFEGKIETLEDGQTFTWAGTELTAYIVAAHTPGSLMVADYGRNLLITGDTFGSGAVWVFWPSPDGNPLQILRDGTSRARDILNNMTDVRILAGHRCQQFWQYNTWNTGEMTIQYFNDMGQVIGGLSDGTSLKEPYASYEGGIEISANGSRARVDTLPEIIDDYLANLYKMPEAYIYSAAPTLSIESVNATAAATMIIFPDTLLTDEEALALLEDTGLKEIVDHAAGTCYVARPANGEAFTEEDMATFRAITSRIYVCANLKLIGYGSGATFINRNLTKYANVFSGILTVGGEAGGEIPAVVPAYVSGNPEAAARYIEANDAEQVGTGNGLSQYVNPENRFALVVTNDAEEDPVTAIRNGWNCVLNRFGRIGNIIAEEGAVGTWYSRPNFTGDDAADMARLYQFFDSIECIADTRREVVTEDLNGSGVLNLWYEYIPAIAENAEPGTVPVVFLMHGNTNDPRTQYDTSGWALVAAREGIILVCPEWQGHTYQGYTYEPMTTDVNATPEADFVKVVGRVLERYPQADPSRVYISGLSAGCRNTTNNGIANPKYFAAGAGQSGPFGCSPEQIALAAEHAAQYDFPMIYFSGDRDEYLMGTYGNLDVNGAITSLQAFETLNDMHVTQAEDLTEENIDLYGVTWDEKYVIEPTAESLCTVIGGVLRNEAGAELCFNRIVGWGHWNYAPDAELMWNFLKKYSRDPETGVLTILEAE